MPPKETSSVDANYETEILIVRIYKYSSLVCYVAVKCQPQRTHEQINM